MAKKETFRFLSGDGRTMIHGVRWRPDKGRHQAVFQIVHGMVEFIDRYEAFAEYLTEKGFLVVGHDHLGHGDSVETKEDWGYMADKSGGVCMIRDIHRVRAATQRQNEGMPYFILGHSMGSYLLRRYLTRYGSGLSGAVIMGTGYAPAEKAGLALGMIRVAAALKGWRFRCPLMEKAVFSGPFREFSLDGTVAENSWLTRDVSQVRTYYADPRCTFHFTLSGFYALMETVFYDAKDQYAARIPADLPILLASGDRDPVGDFGKGVRLTGQQLKRAGVKDVSVKLYRDYRHEILNETDKEIVYQDIAAWAAKVMRRGKRDME